MADLQAETAAAVQAAGAPAEAPAEAPAPAPEAAPAAEAPAAAPTASNTPLVKPWPEWIAAARVGGGPGEVFGRHLERLGPVELQSASSGAEVVARLDIEVEERRICFERAGYYGPVRDLGLPDPPADGQSA